jgi:hypothetical protein
MPLSLDVEGIALPQRLRPKKEVSMKRPSKVILASLAALALSASLLMVSGASATTNFNNAPSGAHYANGSSEPVCTFTSELTVSCTGTAIQGVGNTNAELSLAVTSTFTGVCHNPGKNSKVVEPFTRSDTNTTTATLTPSKNGRLVVPAESATGESSADFLADFTCPNPNWTPEVTGTAISFEYSLTFVGFAEPVILITG